MLIIGIRDTFPRMTCSFNNLYFIKKKFYYLADLTNTTRPKTDLSLWGDYSWKDPIRFPLEIVFLFSTQFDVNSIRFEITHVGTMLQPSLDHFGHYLVEAVLPAAVVLAVNYPELSTSNSPIDLIVTKSIGNTEGLFLPFILSGPKYFTTQEYKNSNNEYYCSSNSNEGCLIHSFAAGM